MEGPIRDLRTAIRAVENARDKVPTGVPTEAVEELARELGETGARRITVVGAMRDVGASMTAIALARALGERSRVVLVDLALAALAYFADFHDAIAIDRDIATKPRRAGPVDDRAVFDYQVV